MPKIRFRTFRLELTVGVGWVGVGVGINPDICKFIGKVGFKVVCLMYLEHNVFVAFLS